MLTHILLQAMATALCGFLIRESYGQATKQLSKRFKSNSEEVEEVLTSLFSLPGQQSSILLAQDNLWNLSPYYPGYLQAANNHSLHLPRLNISYPVSPSLIPERSFAHDHNFGCFYNLTATENVLIHESDHPLPNLLNKALQQGSNLFIDPPRSSSRSIYKTSDFRGFKTFLSQYESTQDELVSAILYTLMKVLLTERERQIQMLASMLSRAITRPGLYAETYQNHKNIILNTSSETPKYDLRGARFSGGFAETVQRKQIGGPQYNYTLTESQILTKAIAEIQKLLKQLRGESAS